MVFRRNPDYLIRNEYSAFFLELVSQLKLQINHLFTMTKKSLFSVVFYFVLFQGITQDLTDNLTFNTGTPSPYYSAGFDDNEAKKITLVNDSTYLQIISSFDWSQFPTPTYNMVRVVRKHANGTVDNYELRSTSSADYNCQFSDVIVDSNGDIVIAENYWDNNANQYAVVLSKYTSDNGASPVGYTLNLNFGSSGTYMLPYGFGFMDAIVREAYNNVGYYVIGKKNNEEAHIARVSVTGTSITGSLSLSPYEYSGRIVDAIVLIDNSCVFADNAIMSSGSNGMYYDRSYLAKVASNLTLDNSFDGDGIVDINWNSSVEGFGNTVVRSIRLEQDAFITICGYSNYLNGTGYFVPKGRITRINNNGTPDSNFGTNGTYADNLGISHWRFNHIDRLATGEYLVSGSYVDIFNTTYQKGMFMRFSANGVLNSAYGANGFMYRSEQQFEISRFSIKPTGEIVYSAISQILGPQTFVPVVGELVENSSVNGMEEQMDASLLIYPNPAHDFIQIVSKKPMHFSLYSIEGKFMGNYATESGVTIDLTGFESGMYYFRTSEGTMHKFMHN